MVKWANRHQYYSVMGLKLRKAKGDGLCYVNAVHQVLAAQYGEEYGLQDIIDIIRKHIEENVNEYVMGHNVGGDREAFKRDIDEFFTKRTYMRDIMDVIIPATANALDITLVTYLQHQGNLFKVTCGTGALIVNLEFHSEHYDALLQLEQNETPFGSPNPSLCPSLASSMSITIDGSEDDEDSGLDDYTIGQNEEDEETPTYLPCETIEEDLQELAKQEHIGHPEQRLYFPEDKFVGMEPEIVDKIPDDIDGKTYYKILNVDAKTWIAKQRDCRNFIMTTSSQVDLKGKRKVGWCRGSLKCTNPDCVFVRMATQRNSHNFSKKHGDKTKRCFSCGMKGVEVQCFAWKLTVYDENTQELHVKHINNHSCALKRDYTKTDQAMCELI